MSQYFQDSSYQKAENYVSYAMDFGENASIQFVLPKEGTKVDELVADGVSITKLLAFKPEEKADVRLRMPKMDYTCNFDLVQVLIKLGMTDALHVDTSDFTKMSKNNAVFSQVNQGVRVKFEEEGIEAAAYTLINTNDGCVPITNEIVEIDLNRLFFYAIKNAEGNVLFAGIIRNV